MDKTPLSTGQPAGHTITDPRHAVTLREEGDMDIREEGIDNHTGILTSKHEALPVSSVTATRRGDVRGRRRGTYRYRFENGRCLGFVETSNFGG